MVATFKHLFSQRVAGACAGLVLLASGAAYAGEGLQPVDLGGTNAPATRHTPAGNTIDDFVGAAETRDSSGNVYGTTASGGSFNRGTVYRLAPDGTKTILHSFTGGPRDGATPVGNLVLDNAGHVYGTTREGGIAGCGTVFEVSPAGERILHSFTAVEGTPALGVLHADATGNLYGATSGTHEALYRLTLDGTLTILFQFA